MQVKAFRGSVEAQFAPTTSRVQLLYRGDRFFATRDVRLADLYPMIEWFKQRRNQLLFTQDGASQGGRDPSTTASSCRTRTKIRDLREHMVADVLCKVRERKSSASEPPPPRGRRAGDATDFDGVLLREVVLLDSPRDWIVANLWDQHAEAKFVARLLAHPGVVELRGVVVSLDAESNQLLANTTPQTQFAFIDSTTTSDGDVRAVEKSFGRDLKAARRSPVLATFEELESQASAASDGLLVVDTVRIERIQFEKHLGSSSRVLPQFVHRFVECYCSVCDDALPELNVDATPPVYGQCTKRCRVRSGKKELLWRYSRLQMVLRDTHEQRLEVEVESNALLELVGSISASMVIRPVDVDGTALSFDVRSAVASLLNTLVDDSEQTFRAEVRCIRGASQTSNDSQRHQNSEPSQDTQQSHQQRTSIFTLASLTPSQCRLII